MKNISSSEEKLKELINVFDVKDERYKGKGVLLFDDIFQTGATINAISDILYNKGKVRDVYVITLTKTRK